MDYDYDDESLVCMNDYPPSTYPRPPAYSGRKDGYTSLPQSDYPPPSGYSAPAPLMISSYAPAPPVMQQQCNNNVVITSNQPASPSVIHAPPPRANDYLNVSCALLVLCLLHGNLPGVFLFIAPALFCASAARDHNNAGNYDGAKSCGMAALCCNVFAIVYFILLVLAGVAAVLAYFFYIRYHISEIENAFNGIIDELTPAPPQVCCLYNFSGECVIYC